MVGVVSSNNNKPKNYMNILHLITVSNTATGEQSLRHLMRSKRLTYRGAERILRASGMSADCTVVRIETAICR